MEVIIESFIYSERKVFVMRLTFFSFNLDVLLFKGRGIFYDLRGREFFKLYSYKEFFFR